MTDVPFYQGKQSATSLQQVAGAQGPASHEASIKQHPKPPVAFCNPAQKLLKFECTYDQHICGSYERSDSDCSDLTVKADYASVADHTGAKAAQYKKLTSKI